MDDIGNNKQFMAIFAKAKQSERVYEKKAIKPIRKITKVQNNMKLIEIPEFKPITVAPQSKSQTEFMSQLSKFRKNLFE